MGERALNTMSARYLTSDPTVSLSTVRDGRPVYDFAAAPSLFLEEDLRQEEEMLRYRQGTCAALKQAECDEAAAVAHRQKCEADAAAALANERQKAAIAAEAREIEVRAVEQRAAIEAAYADAEACARAAMERCKELQHMLSSAATEQERASAARSSAAADAEMKSTHARGCEAAAVDARRAQNCAFAERRTLETQGYRQPQFVDSALGARGGYLLD